MNGSQEMAWARARLAQTRSPSKEQGSQKVSHTPKASIAPNDGDNDLPAVPYVHRHNLDLSPAHKQERVNELEEQVLHLQSRLAQTRHHVLTIDSQPIFPTFPNVP